MAGITTVAVEQLRPIAIGPLTLTACRTTHDAAEPMKGFGGGCVLEIVEDDDGETYRGVYTVKFSNAVYVLHVFQKKSTKGIKTSKGDIDLIRENLETAEADAKAEIKSRNASDAKRT